MFREWLQTKQLVNDMKILLIEDSKFLRIANGRALVKAGYGVIHAGDGEEGLRLAREDIPDLILLDMMLPKLSGLDVLRALKSDPLAKHIPVIVLSGLSQANEVKLLNEGAAAFLVKSETSLENNSSVLIQAVEDVLKGTTVRKLCPPITPAQTLGNPDART
jgi:twitching motility two-component system response regulator PilH